jgi:hypothetical protein
LNGAVDKLKQTKTTVQVAIKDIEQVRAAIDDIKRRL